MIKTSNPSSRFYLLDVLRGFAALSVVLWHWPHFFLNEPGHFLTVEEVDRAALPLHFILKPFYASGWRAVELFFTLSGFIFYWLYATRITQRVIGLTRYLVLRGSRLYPLHLATLSAVIVGQFLFLHWNGSFFVYGMSWSALPGNLTLTGNWLSTAFLFNGPAWSVSIEMLMYLFFFGLCRLGITRWWQAAGLVILGWSLRDTRLDLAGAGIMSFFTGGMTYHFFIWLKDNLSRSAKVAFIIGAFPVIFALALLLRYGTGLAIPTYFVELTVFPVVILTLALVESTFGPGIGRHLHFIGDISYSSYLWHFPLQLGFVVATTALGLDRMIFYKPATLCLFYVVLIGVSLLSFYRFERPMQNYFRRKWMMP